MNPTNGRKPGRAFCAGLGVLTFLLCLGTLGNGRNLQAQPAPADAVERLRQVLQDTAEVASHREQRVRACIDGLQGMGDLRRAVALAEWMDRAPQGDLAAVDRAQRQIVANRFLAAARDMLSRKEPGTVSLALEILVEMATASRESSDTPPLARCLTPEVIGLVRSGEPRVRLSAARALGMIDAEAAAATPALADLLQSSEPNLRRAAADALANLLQSAVTAAGAASGSPEARHDAAMTAATVLSALTPGYADSQADIRLCCVAAVSKAATGIQPLVSEPPQASGDDDSERRYGATRLQSERRDLRPLVVGLADQVPHLSKALRDSDATVRLPALEALEALARVRWQWVRQGIWLAGPVKAGVEPEVDDPLAAGFSGALPPLATALTDRDVRVRRGALDVLEAFGPAAAPAAPAVSAALSDRDRFVRWSAVRTLQAIGAPAALPAIPALARVLNDTDVDVTLAAIEALVHLDRTGQGVPPRGKHPHKNAASHNAVVALANAVKVHDGKVRIAAIQALGGMGENARPAVPALAAALGDPDARVRHAAADALGQLGPVASDAVPDLNLALKDSDPGVRRAASDAVLRITRGTQP